MQVYVKVCTGAFVFRVSESGFVCVLGGGIRAEILARKT